MPKLTPICDRRAQERRTGARSGAAWLSQAKLEALIHVDAFRLSPRAYVSGLWWRLLGKRLRARSRLSPLLGRSRHAYAVWLARRCARAAYGAVVGAQPANHGNFSALPTLTVVVEAGVDKVALARTLASLDNPQAAIVIEGAVGSAARRSSFEQVAVTLGKGGGWLLPISAGDTLAPNAQRRYAHVSMEVKGFVVYADDDVCDVSGQRCAPHFKPDWNPELFRHHNYLSGASIVWVDQDALLAVIDLPDWIDSLTLKVLRGSNGEWAPHHLPAILHHRAKRPSPTTPAAVKLPARAQMPKVSVIIPTRNGTQLLRTCLEGLAQTDYPEMEIVIVDNDSDDPTTLDLLSKLELPRHKILRHPGPFNYSAINNAAVRQTSSPFLCFLNNDIEILDPNWLSILVAQARRDDVGAVGPMLVYPDGSVQHAGVVLGVGGGAAHAHRDVRPEEHGYFCRHALPQFVSAVTGACLVVQRARFKLAGGFDEENFPVAFNDVDLCLKLAKLGYAALYEPRTRLIHHESKSRGHDRDPIGARRLAGELAALKAIWHTDQKPDPYHHPSLSPYSEQFVVDL
ncbi:Glycosyltransferase, GT2 family [Novosphingobium mathurense]|uniref:Glycosyltransferase, GT2 family n=1 Tax=Novosphingobium mathurense TaxID=428990 RepID=A0A1U6ITQ7_9SPHN|nr:Glycosyltransferase, GT2 family [Novosphingobium mathurense]